MIFCKIESAVLGLDIALFVFNGIDQSFHGVHCLSHTLCKAIFSLNVKFNTQIQVKAYLVSNWCSVHEIENNKLRAAFAFPMLLCLLISSASPMCYDLLLVIPHSIPQSSIFSSRKEDFSVHIPVQLMSSLKQSPWKTFREWLASFHTGVLVCEHH